MAEDGSGDRTLPATEARKQRARDEGQAPLSRELVTLCSLAAATGVFAMAGPGLVGSLGRRLTQALMLLDAPPGAALEAAAASLLVTIGPLLAVVVCAGAGSVLVQTGGLLKTDALLPDLSRLSPKRGLARIFGLDGAVDTLKSLAKVGVLGWAAWRAVTDAVPRFTRASQGGAEAAMQSVSADIMHVLLLTLACQTAIALADTGWVRFQFARRLRMSGHDIKQEHKEAEGDPHYKGKLRQIRMSRARRRMLAAVPKATVVITNPTHYAVALSYDRGAQAAPRVVAKGMDEVAARIREMAARHGVPLVANPPLARALHKIELDRDVPAEHFKAVAEIIAYVWRLKARAGDAR